MKRFLHSLVIIFLTHPSQWQYEFRKLKNDSDRKIR